MRASLAILLLTVFLTPLPAVEPGNWMQFRGPASATAVGANKLPGDIGPDRNVLWKVPLDPGHSSPIVSGDRIFLTAARGKRLLTIGMDRATGKILWEAVAPYKQLEKIHGISSHAASTPVTDGQLVVSFFGSSGLSCYDRDGKVQWHVPLGPFKNELGAGSSPILLGDAVFLNMDHDSGSFLLAVDKRTGKTLWRVERPDFTCSYATPVVWDVNGKKQLVVNGTLRAVGYDPETGKEIWTVRGLARAVHLTPTVGPDNTLYIGGWTSGADAGERFDAPPWAEMLAKHDTNKNGTLEQDEFPPGPLKERFLHFDANKDGHVSQEEYEAYRKIILTAVNRVMAVRPGGVGDITMTHVLWEQPKNLPAVPSPLYAAGHLFLVKNPGILTSLDAASGKIVKSERVSAGSDYYASPVFGDGKVYLLSQRGHCTVVSAEGQWKVLSRARFDEDVYATPALVDGKIYLRTAGYLYCFGER
jgi:outer membrane protein assembly factor BamB